MLPEIHGEFGIVKPPEIRFNDSGKAWAKLRCSFKDRKRDSNGNWTDGEPQYLDVIVNHQAENLIESVSVGDSVVISGHLVIRTYEVDGQTRLAPEIKAENVGVSVRWTTAKSFRVVEEAGKGTESPVQEEAPF